MEIIKFKLKVDKDVTAGQYELKIKEYEEGKAEVSATHTLNIEVQSRESAEVIYIDKTVLVPGKEDSLTFTINNVGSAPLRDLTFSWINLGLSTRLIAMVSWMRNFSWENSR